jgi:hypothetical protein
MFSANTTQVSTTANYIEDVFSTWLYTGTGAAQTITNGIDLLGKGGLVWVKSRNDTTSHFLFDTSRGTTKEINSNTTDAEATLANSLTAFNANGFTVGSATGIGTNGNTYASWTFRKQPKFFDVVTYTGTGSATTIAHNLGSVPGCIIVKRTDAVIDWAVYHRSLANTQYMVLNTTAAAATAANMWNSTTPTSSVFSVGTLSEVNSSGGTYVAYLFAHNAGGFGNTGTDNVISCGSFTTDSGGIATVNLGYEPQWFLIKRTDTAGDNWFTFDVMRGWDTSSNDKYILPNSSGSEGTQNIGSPTATGFTISDSSNGTFIYIAIRRGPMKTPTVGTSVFGLNARTGTGANATVTGGQTDDAVLIKNRGAAVASLFSSRLTGTGYLVTSTTAAEVAAGATILQANPWDVMDGVKVGTTSTITNASANTFINYLFRRAPGFFDVVCYTGNATANPQSHNLGVAPELVIIKSRSSAQNWLVLHTFTASDNQYQFLNTNAVQLAIAYGSSAFLSSIPTGTQLPVTGPYAQINASAATYVAYLFATVAGVSKVGSYTGTAALLTVNCGFTTGARFVLIKRTDSTGDWYVWDSARGITSGNDPYLLLNAASAEVTTTNYVDTDAAGFKVTAAAPVGLNASGGTYIFLAIA